MKFCDSAMVKTFRPPTFSLRTGLLALLSLLVSCVDSDSRQSDFENHSPLSDLLDGPTRTALLQENMNTTVSLPRSLIEAQMHAWQGLPVGQRIARWAELFWRRGDATYLFGLKEGGYVADSLLVQDFKQDCVLFFYRCTELARSASASEAVFRALDTRFAGGSATQIVNLRGKVDYDDPSHLDYSLDIIRSGIWGPEVTVEIGEAVPDLAGTSRYPAGSFHYIPTKSLRLHNFLDGDLLFFVFDENSQRGSKFRKKYGLVVGHQGIVQTGGNQVFVIHAASSDLQGEYEGNRVVRVPLHTYLERVESYKGVIVTRLRERRPSSAK